MRIGKYVTLEIESENESKAMEKATSACKELIANPIIEDFEITLENIK